MTKKASFWVRRRSHLPILFLGGLTVMLLYFNDETSWSQNMEFDKRISDLKQKIKLESDSVDYFRSRRMAVESGQSDLEHMAREQFRMQRPTEDVYIIK